MHPFCSTGIPANRIIIGGFSQGGHIAYKAALLHEPRVAACIALSTYLDPDGVKVRIALVLVTFRVLVLIALLCLLPLLAEWLYATPVDQLFFEIES